MGEPIRVVKREKGTEGPGTHGLVEGSVNQYVVNGKTDPATGANWGSGLPNEP